MDTKALEDFTNDLWIKAEKNCNISLTIQSNALWAKKKKKIVEMKKFWQNIQNTTKIWKAAK